ncbi:hypothetical protein H1R20_g3904, partial [Candolleomyces eurysporus]
MVSKLLAPLVFLVSLYATEVAAVPHTGTGCAAVHVIAGRASTEPSGPGIIGALVTQVQQQSSQTVSTSSVDYPATLTNYASSSAQGTAATKTLLTNQVNRCPNQKIVLVGYSQGAHIVGDAVAGGGGGLLGARTDPVPASISNKVVAIVQMGDPRRTKRAPYNLGTATGLLREGMFPRLASQEYSTTLQPRIQNYCDFGDTFCDSGLDTAVHLTYLSRYQTPAANFILTQIGG